jgi:hypothetical protein
LFNNAAQVWNHTFYWNCLKPGGGGDPSGKAAEAIKKSFGDFKSFKEKFSAAAAGQFGSGWAWVVKTGDGIAIETTSNAGTPMATGKTCVLTLDVWEHDYYIDYRNARPTYIEEFWKLVNWDFVSKNLACCAHRATGLESEISPRGLGGRSSAPRRVLGTPASRSEGGPVTGAEVSVVEVREDHLGYTTHFDVDEENAIDLVGKEVFEELPARASMGHRGRRVAGLDLGDVAMAVPLDQVVGPE